MAVAVAAGCAGSSARADEMKGSPAKPVVVMGGAEQWAPMKGRKGVQVAQIFGDMTKPGPYVIRLLLPSGTTFPPHWHPAAEQVTVISGTFSVGLGKKMDVSKMTVLGAGSFVEVPAGLPHYAMAKTKVELELHGDGPFVITPVK